MGSFFYSVTKGRLRREGKDATWDHYKHAEEVTDNDHLAFTKPKLKLTQTPFTGNSRKKGMP